MADRPFTVTRAKLLKAFMLITEDMRAQHGHTPDEIAPHIKARLKRVGLWGIKGPPPIEKAAEFMADSLIAYLKEH